MHDVWTKLLSIALFLRQQQVKDVEEAHGTLSTAGPATVAHHTSPVRGQDQHGRGQNVEMGTWFRAASR